MDRDEDDIPHVPVPDSPQGTAAREKSIERMRQAWAMRCRGWSHIRIAENIGITHSGVSRLLKRAESRVLAQLDDDVRRVKILQAEQLAHLLDESLQAWERSKAKAVSASRTRTERGVAGSEGHFLEEKNTQHGQERDGDVSYLEMARSVLADIRTLHGLDPKAAVPGSAGGNVILINSIEAVPAPRRMLLEDVPLAVEIAGGEREPDGGDED